MQIVLFGMGPWPLEPGAIVIAPSVRLRQFVEPLLAAKHDVSLVLLEDHLRPVPTIPSAQKVVVATPDTILNPKAIMDALGLEYVDAFAGVGSLMPATAAARAGHHFAKPCWVDFYGDPLTELHALQLRQGGEADPVLRDHIWKLMREALLYGDAFSTVSNAQRHALMGQLGLLGRFGTDWELSSRLHEITIGIPKAWTRPVPLPDYPEGFRSLQLGDKVRIIVFTGSWNVWMDEETMGRALAEALRLDPSLHLVMSGIPTGPAGESVRRNLIQHLADGNVAGRLHEIPAGNADSESALFAHAATSIILDRAIPESELGARTRLLPMVRWGLKPVVSLNAEIEALIAAEGIASGIAQGDWQRAARELVANANRSPEERREDTESGRRFLEAFVFESLLEPMVRWLSQGAPRWPERRTDGLLDRWAQFPAEPEKLFGKDSPQKKGWFFR